MVRSRSYIATPPGTTIKEQLCDRGMSQKEFAARMDMSEKHISRLINGDVQLTPEMSVRLETVLGVPASFWNNLEAIYREKLVKAEAENAMDVDMDIAKRFPYIEMEKFGWIPGSREEKKRVAYLRKYFEVVELSLLENELVTKIAGKRLSLSDKGDLALMAWAQEAKKKARDIQTAPINIKGLSSAVSEIRKMTVLEPAVFSPLIKKDLADCGIALIFLPHLKGLVWDGASFIDGNKYVVGLMAGERYADQFWYSLFRELGHISLGHVIKADHISDADNVAANRWASEMLIKSDDFERFRSEKDYSEKSVLRFARNQGITPGIVVGKMQTEGLIKPDAMNNLKNSYEIAI